MTAGVAFATLDASQLAARWRALQDDPSAPDHCELDAYGDLILMNPPRKAHQRIVAAMMRQIVEQLGGEALPGLGVVTRVGVRVPDVIWQPRPTADDPASPAPDICVEVQSPDNTRRELDEKVAAYLDAGAREVILVDLAGRIRHFSTAGETEISPHGLRLTVPEGTYPVR